MSYNPYAAPTAQEPSLGPPQFTPGQPQPWDVGEVLGIGWETVKRQWPVLVFAPFVSGMISGVPNYLPGVLVAADVLELNSATYWTFYGISTSIGLVLSMFFQAGQIRIFVAAARGQTPELGQIFTGASRFLPLLGTMLLAGLGAGLGFAMLIVPGVILSLGFSLAQFYCVDADMGPIDALKASWEATRGHKGALFVFGLVSMVVMLLGLAACCLGLYVALPVVMVAMATIYLRVSGRFGPPAGQGNWPPGYGGQDNWPPPQGGPGYGAGYGG